MTNIEIAGQIISILAMACNILSFQHKKQAYLITFQLFGGALFSISFFMLGATIGGLLNLVATIRAIIFLFSEKLRSTHFTWLLCFIIIYFSLYILSFTLFNVEPNLTNFIIEFLPVIGMTASSIGFMLANSKAVRRLGLISSPSWLAYNICHLSIGAIICEIISICSIFIGMYRHDRDKTINQ